MSDISRREFFGYGLGTGAALAFRWTMGAQPASAATSGRLSKYVQPLPVPGHGIVVASPTGSADTYGFTLREISRQLHPQLPPTPFWAYDDGSGLGGQAGSFGMAVAAQSGTPLTIQLHARPPGHVPGLDPGGHAADAARQRGAGDDAPARRLRRGRQ